MRSVCCSLFLWQSPLSLLRPTPPTHTPRSLIGVLVVCDVLEILFSSNKHIPPIVLSVTHLHTHISHSSYPTVTKQIVSLVEDIWEVSHLLCLHSTLSSLLRDLIF